MSQSRRRCLFAVLAFSLSLAVLPQISAQTILTVETNPGELVIKGLGFGAAPGAAAITTAQFPYFANLAVTQWQPQSVTASLDPSTPNGAYLVRLTTAASAQAYFYVTLGTPPPVPPVGSIVAWHKNISPTPLELPEAWVECNGQVIQDPESPLQNLLAPDLNGEGRFLRGNGQSGNLQAATRILSRAELSGRISVDKEDGSDPAGDREFLREGGDFEGASWRSVRPINMSVVWIMRIK